MADLEMNCGSGISDVCKNAKIPMTEAGFQKFVGELVGAATFILTAVAQAGAETDSLNMMKAKNALRCAIVSFGDNGWNMIAALYYLAKQFGQEGTIKEYLDEYYPYVCTCTKEVDKISKTFGANALSQEVNSSCSERAQATNSS